MEERLPLMFSEAVKGEHLTIPQVVHYLCANPAKIAGLYPKKGTIQTGSDADLVLIDPKKEWTITTEKMQWKRGLHLLRGYEGDRCHREGIPARSGNCYRRKLVGTRGEGQYLKRGKSSLAE